MRKRWFGALLFAASSSLAGCATIVHGTRQTVTVTSQPSGAMLTVLSERAGEPAVVKSRPGVTPIQLDLTRRDPHILLRLEKDGCTPTEVRLTRTASGWIALNFAFANPLAGQGLDSTSDYVVGATTFVGLGVGIDALTGGAFKLPKRVHATLCAQ